MFKLVVGQDTCNPCGHNMKMGLKIFCNKHSKILNSPASNCNDFTKKLHDDLKEKAIFHSLSKSTESVEPTSVEDAVD